MPEKIKSFRASYLEKRYHTFFAVYYVPADVRPLMGRSKLTRTTKTGDRRKAEQKALAFVLECKSKIEKYRAGAFFEDPLISEAKDFLSCLKNGSPIGITLDAIEERASEVALNHDAYTASVFKKVSKGQLQILSDFVDDWKSDGEKRGLKTKTLDQRERDITLFCENFPYEGTITKKDAIAWIEITAESLRLSPSSVERIVDSCKAFFLFLQRKKVIDSSESNPFVVPEQFRRTKKRQGPTANQIKPWVPFEKLDLQKIYDGALLSNDIDLANLIAIGAHSGARIEEICSLRVNQINFNELFFDIQDAKTPAGIRKVPIHDRIVDLVKHLASSSSDNFLISNLSVNKYGDRSNAIGKRFGRLKKKLGFGAQHVFHSLRKTVVTELENLGISENLAADIVGHEKPNITYGLYSGGSSISLRRDAINKMDMEITMKKQD